MTTIFTRIIEGDIPAEKVYEDDNFLAFMDINPVNKGHVLVITKEPYPTLKDAPEDIVSNLFKVVHKLTPAVMKASKSELFNWYVIGDEVPHAHVHIVPRFPDDEAISLNTKKYDYDEIKVFAESIRNELKK